MSLLKKRLEHSFPDKEPEIISLCVIISIFSISESDGNILCDWLIANRGTAEEFLDKIHWTPYGEAGDLVKDKITFLQGGKKAEEIGLFFETFEKVNGWLSSFWSKRPEGDGLRLR